jgi:hypothetical protein
MSRSSVMSYISIELPTICFVVCSSLYEGIGSIDLERETGVEPATSSLARKHSTTELLPLSQDEVYLSRSYWSTQGGESVPSGYRGADPERKICISSYQYELVGM